MTYDERFLERFPGCVSWRDLALLVKRGVTPRSIVVGADDDRGDRRGEHAGSVAFMGIVPSSSRSASSARRRGTSVSSCRTRD